MPMDWEEQELQRTWVQLLVENNYAEIAAIAVDTDIRILHKFVAIDPGLDLATRESYGIAFEIPTSSYALVNTDDMYKLLMERAMRAVAQGHVSTLEDLVFEYRIKLIEPEDEDWREVIRDLIANSRHPNQAVVTEKMFWQEKKEPINYNEMKFGSKSEVRIAQELEDRRILFFPLPLAVRAETGRFFQDHREVDFLICHDGLWGILEVAYHPDRYEKDKEKDAWFKQSGILCIEHYPAEKCYDAPAVVVDEFLEILAKHKR